MSLRKFKRILKLFNCRVLAFRGFRFAVNNQSKVSMKFLLLNRANTRFENTIKCWKTILIIFLFIFSISRKNKPALQTIQIKFNKPVNGFRTLIYWTPQYAKTDPDDKEKKWVVGKAILILERIADKVKYKVVYDLSMDYFVDADFKKSLYESFLDYDLPGIVTISNSIEKGIIDKDDPLFYERSQSFFFFKDVNFDDKAELLVVPESLQVNYHNKFHRVFEFQNDKLAEFEYFPSLVFTYSRNYIGKINYQKKEISVSSFYSCCEYDTDFYRLDRNSTNNFVLYKTEKIYLHKPTITKYYKE